MMLRTHLVVVVVAVTAGCPPPDHEGADAGPPPGMSVHLVKGGDGHGTLSSTPEGVDCDALCESQDVVFPNDAKSVSLNADPARDALFANWSCESKKDGVDQPSQTQQNTGINFTDDDPGSLDITCTATFRQLWTVLVIFTGTGTGRVDGSQPGSDGAARVHCHSGQPPQPPDDKCTAGYFNGDEETLTPTADTGSVFVGWRLDCADGADGPATLTMTQDMNCEAHFCLENDPACE